MKDIKITKNSTIELLDDNKNYIELATVISISYDKLLISSRDRVDNLYKDKTNINFAYGHEKRGRIICNAEIQDIEEMKIRLVNIEEVESNQRRQELRVKTSIPIELKTVQLESKGKINLPKPLSMEIIDMSASGVRLKTGLELPSNMELFLSLPLTYKTINVRANIIRKRNKEDYFEYACRFVGATETTKCEIREFVFRTEIYQRKKKTK